MAEAIPGLGRYTARLRSAAKRREGVVAEIAEEAAAYGAEQMREMIASRGTGYVGRGPRATAEGRIDYGRMYDAVESTRARRTASGGSASFGWLTVRKDYFIFQEEGFKTVPPMHALLDATVKARAYFYQRIKETTR